MMFEARNGLGGIGAMHRRAIPASILALAAASFGMTAMQAAAPVPVVLAGLTVDRLSAVLSALVASIGAIAYVYSLRYLDGSPRQAKFLNRLAFTVAAAYLFMLASWLPLLFLAWSLTSVGLHSLLTFCHERPEAHRPARKKFLISRLGDVALIAAIVLIWRGWGTLDINAFRAAALAGEPDSGVRLIGLLIAVAAMTKSAQFPFHSWLPETMEAPTPVSALMHAGIINAGGALLLRFAPVLVRQPEALLLLTCVGTLTFALGMMAMWAQVKAKRTLAWSTVSQMGFMMVQFGLGAFPVVAVHIVGHGCYKAWSFLRSGEMPASTKAVVPPRRALRLAAMGTAAAVPLIAAASWVTGFSPAHSPGELALTAILAMSVGQLWVAMLATPAGASARGAVRLAATLSVSFVACTAAFAIYAGAAAFLAPVFGPVEPPSGPIAWLAACLPVVTLAALLTIHAWLPEMNAAAWGRALHVHALHGFYFGAIADRFVEWVWRSPVHNGSGANHA